MEGINQSVMNQLSIFQEWCKGPHQYNFIGATAVENVIKPKLFNESAWIYATDSFTMGMGSNEIEHIKKKGENKIWQEKYHFSANVSNYILMFKLTQKCNFLRVRKK